MGHIGKDGIYFGFKGTSSCTKQRHYEMGLNATASGAYGLYWDEVPERFGAIVSVIEN